MPDNLEKGDGRPSGGGAPSAGAVTSHLVEGATMALPDGCVVTVREGMLEVSDGQRLPLPTAGGNVTIERRVRRPDGRTVLVRHTVRMEQVGTPAKSAEPEDLPAVPDGTGKAENPSQAEAGAVDPTSEERTEPPGEGAVGQGPSEQEPEKENSGEPTAQESSLVPEETGKTAVLCEEGTLADTVNVDKPTVAVVETEAASVDHGQGMPENSPTRAPDGNGTEAAAIDTSSEDENGLPKTGSEGRDPIKNQSLGQENGDEPSELAPSNEETQTTVAKAEDVTEPGSDHVVPEIAEKEVPKTDTDTDGGESDVCISPDETSSSYAKMEKLIESSLTVNDATDQVENLPKDFQPAAVKDEVLSNEAKSPKHSSEHPRRHPTKYLVHQDSISITRSVPRLHSRTLEPAEKLVDKDITDEVQMRLGPILQRLGYATSATKQDHSDESNEKAASETESPDEPEHVSVTEAINFFESITPQRVESPVLWKHPPSSSLSPSQKRSDTKSPEPCLVSPTRASPGRASPRRVNFASRAQKVYISSQEPDEMEDILVPCPHDDSPPQDIPDPFYTEPTAVPAVMKLPTKITMIPAQKPFELDSDSCDSSPNNDPADAPGLPAPASKNGDIQRSSVHTLYSKASMEPATCAGPGNGSVNSVPGSELDGGQQPAPDDPELVEDLMHLMSDIEALDTKSPRNPSDAQNEWPGHLRLAEEEASTASLDGDLSDGGADTTPPTSSAAKPSVANGVQATEAVPQLGVNEDGDKVVTDQPTPLTSDGDETDRLQALPQTELQEGDMEADSGPKDPFLPEQKQQEKVNWLAECLFCCCCWAP